MELYFSLFRNGSFNKKFLENPYLSSRSIYSIRVCNVSLMSEVGLELHNNSFEF